MRLRSDSVQVELAKLKQKYAVVSAELEAERERNDNLDKEVSHLRTELQSSQAAVLKTRHDYEIVVSRLNEFEKRKDNENEMESPEMDWDSSARNAFDFTLLPPELQRMVASEMPFLSFISLKKTSKAMRSLCGSLEERGYLPEFPVELCFDSDMQDFKYHWARCRDGDCQVVTTPMFHPKDTDTKCKIMVDFHESDHVGDILDWPSNLCLHKLTTVETPPVEEFCQFLEVHEVRVLRVRLFASEDINSFLGHAAVKQLVSLRLEMDEDVTADPITTENLLSLCAVRISLPNIDRKSIRPYLKEWISGKRDISCSFFAEVCGFVPSDVESMVDTVKNEILFDLDITQETIDYNTFQVKLSRGDYILVVRFEYMPPHETPAYVIFDTNLTKRQ